MGKQDKAAFVGDEMAYDAVLHNLKVIGEAATKLPDHVTNEIPEVPWADLRGMRNMLVHEYFGADEDIIWKAATEEVFSLKTALEGFAARNQDR